MTHLVGSKRAMDLVLTGRKITGTEAGQWGLVSRVVGEGDSVVEKAVEVAEKVASFGEISVQAGKEAVLAGELLIHRGLYQMLIVQPTSFLFKRVFTSNAVCSSSCSLPPTKRKAWLRSPRSARPNSHMSRWKCMSTNPLLACGLCGCTLDRRR